MKILTCKDLDNYPKETIFAYILELQSQVMKLNIIIEHSSEQNQRNVDDLSNQVDVLGNLLKESTDNQFIHKHEINKLRELLKKEQAKNSKLTDDNKLLTMQFTDKKNECKSLKSRVKDLESRLNIKIHPASDNPNTPSSKQLVKPTSTKENRAKKGGAKKNHKGNGRPKIDKNNADEIIKIRKPENFCCIHDNEVLTFRGTKHHGYRIFVPGHWKNAYEEIDLYDCRKCGSVYSFNSDTLQPKSSFSNNTKSLLCEEVYCYPHSIGEVERRYGVNHGTLLNIFNNIADTIAPIYDFQKVELLNSPLVQVDETGWREDGEPCFCWNMMNDKICHFTYIKSRSSYIPSKIFGVLPKYKFSDQGKKIPLSKEEQQPYMLDMVIISDFYGGYNNLPARKQRCFEHYKRMLDTLNKDVDSENIKKFVSDVKPWIIKAIKIDKELSIDEYQKQAAIIESNIRYHMDIDYNDATVKQYQLFFWKYNEQLFQWTTNPTIDSHNNKCESSIRPVAIDRAVVFGSQGEAGARMRSIISSVMLTIKKRGFSPVEFLTNLLNAKTRNPNLDVVEFYLDYCNLKREDFKIKEPLNFYQTLPSDNGEYQGEYPNWLTNKLSDTYLIDEFDWQYLKKDESINVNLPDTEKIQYLELTEDEIKTLDATLTDVKTGKTINYTEIKNQGFYIKIGKNLKRCKNQSRRKSKNQSTFLADDKIKDSA